jgi:acyl carrier protein
MKDYTDLIKKIMSIIFDEDIVNISDDAEPLEIDQWDSINHLQLIVALEEEFEIKFSDDELTELLNLPLINNIIQQKLKDK